MLYASVVDYVKVDESVKIRPTLFAGVMLVEQKESSGNQE